MAEIKFAQLNIERAKHFPRIIPFLKEFSPDVFTMQEVREQDIPFLEKELGVKSSFVPMTIHPDGGSHSVIGICIFSRFPALNFKAEYYFGGGSTPTFRFSGDMDNMNRVFAYSDIEKDGEIFRIGTTHFTWSKDGETSDIQRRDLKKLIPIIENAGEIVFAGDFNAPRGKEIFSGIAEKYKDNVPEKYITSIDPVLHRNGKIMLMVDCLWSTPSYEVSDVKMICGVSDHCALTAKIRKK